MLSFENTHKPKALMSLENTYSVWMKSFYDFSKGVKIDEQK
jgi:hypothetical protein